MNLADGSNSKAEWQEQRGVVVPEIGGRREDTLSMALFALK